MIDDGGLSPSLLGWASPPQQIHIWCVVLRCLTVGHCERSDNLHASIWDRPLLDYGEANLAEFLTGTNWLPNGRNPSFGIRPLLSGTALIAVGSLAISIPLGVAAALHLGEFASPRSRGSSSPSLSASGILRCARLLPLLISPSCSGPSGPTTSMQQVRSSSWLR